MQTAPPGFELGVAVSIFYGDIHYTTISSI